MQSVFFFNFCNTKRMPSSFLSCCLVWDNHVSLCLQYYLYTTIIFNRFGKQQFFQLKCHTDMYTGKYIISNYEKIVMPSKNRSSPWHLLELYTHIYKLRLVTFGEGVCPATLTLTYWILQLVPYFILGKVLVLSSAELFEMENISFSPRKRKLSLHVIQLRT